MPPSLPPTTSAFGILSASQPSGIGRGGGRSGPRSALRARLRFPVDLDQLDEAVDAVVGEGRDAFVAEAQDPDEAVLGLHFDSGVEQEVDIFAEVFGDAVDGP